MSVVFCRYRSPWFFFKKGYWMCIVWKCSTTMTIMKIAGGADQAGGGDQGLGEGHRWTEAGDQGRQACPSDCYFFWLAQQKYQQTRRLGVPFTPVGSFFGPAWLWQAVWPTQILEKLAKLLSFGHQQSFFCYQDITKNPEIQKLYLSNL